MDSWSQELSLQGVTSLILATELECTFSTSSSVKYRKVHCTHTVYGYIVYRFLAVAVHPVVQMFSLLAPENDGW